MGKTENREFYTGAKIGPLIEKAVVVDSQNYRLRYREQSETVNGVIGQVMGTAGGKKLEVPPSMASMCLRWVGYEKIGERIPAPNTPEQEVVLMMGRTLHNAMARTLRGYGMSELSFVNNDSGVAGRIDFLFNNPKTEEYHVVDFKFVGDYKFRKITRSNLPKTLQNTKGIYNPPEEERLQLLLYMHAARSMKYPVEFGNLIYINRNNAKMKECLVPWDAVAQYDTDIFLEQIKEARSNISEGKLPPPSVKSEYICASFCPYRTYCDYGKEFVAGKVRKQSKRKPNWVYKRAKRQHEERERNMIEAGISQPVLFQHED